jgi:hypothetical protein
MSSFWNFYKIKNLEYSYMNSDSLFKILYDKYVRREIYDEVNTTWLNKVKKNKSEMKIKLTKNFKWIDKETLDNITITTENTPDQSIILEDKSLKYLKTCLRFVNYQMISFSATAGLVTGVILHQFIKPIQRSKYSQPVFFFVAFNIMIFNIYLVFSMNDFSKNNKEILEKEYNRLIEKYNIILS